MPTTNRVNVPHATIAGLAVPTDVSIPDLLVPIADNLVATAGGAQAGTALLANTLNRGITVATGGDSFQLPACPVGTQLFFVNAAAANSANVFGQTGDAVNAVAANGAYAVASNKMVHFIRTATTRWHAIVTA